MIGAGSASVLDAPEHDAAVLACPFTGAPLVAHDDALVAGQRRYPIENGIARLYAPVGAEMAGRDITERVKAFYEETPFPNYDDDETPTGLQAKARQNLLLNALDQELPETAMVLEAGCGTGQLSNFLGLSPRRQVFGGDICLNSLGLANGFREKHGIVSTRFLQMNLFRPPFRDDSLDLVICNGVLHHTADAHGGFTALLRKVKPGGHILVGLYNSYARLPTLWRRWAFAKFGSALHFMDWRLGSRGFNETRRRAWYRDQYEHPHESRHSMDEVLDWFDAAGVEFVSALPPADGGAFAGDLRLFSPQPCGSRLSRMAVQTKLLLEGGKDGGVFIMVGRKREAATRS